MTVLITEDDLPAVIRVAGELDSLTAGQLREELARGSAHDEIVVDLRDVPFVDSAGLGALVGGLRRMREAGRRVAICSPRPSVRRLLAMTGVDRLAPVVDSPAEARRVLAEP